MTQLMKGHCEQVGEELPEFAQREEQPQKQRYRNPKEIV